MKNRASLFFIFSLFSSSLGLLGMDPNVRALSEELEAEKPLKERLRSASRPEVISEGKRENLSGDPASSIGSQLIVEGRQGAVIQQINEAEEFVNLASPFFSDPKIQKALIAAHERGVDVLVKVGSRAKIDSLLKANIKVEVISGLHAKTIITDKCALIGSDNLSCLSAAREAELLLQTDKEQAPRYHKKGINRFKRMGLSPKGRGLTPKKKTPIRHTMRRGHTGYKAMRLQRFVLEPSAANRIDVGSMTFNSDRFVSQVEQTYANSPSGQRPFMRFFLDRSALKHSDLLARMKKAGGDDLDIYIFNAEGSQKIWDKYPDIMHKKYIARKIVDADGKDQKYVIISTGNLAGQSDLDINIDSHHPGDSALYDELIAQGDIYASSPEWTKYQPQQ